MNRNAVLILVSALLAPIFIQCHKNNTDQPGGSRVYVPLKLGDQWIYDEYTLNASGNDSFVGQSVWTVDYQYPKDSTQPYDSLYSIGHIEGNNYMWGDFRHLHGSDYICNSFGRFSAGLLNDLPYGQSFVMTAGKSPSDTSSTVVITGQEPLDVPAGSYICIQTTDRDSFYQPQVAYSYTNWYAPGVGRAKIIYTETHNGVVFMKNTYLLRSYSLK